MNKGIFAVSMIFVLGLSACGPSSRQNSVSRGLDEYARLARSIETPDGNRSGSIWTEQAGYADAFRDVKARRAGDIVTIEVIESTSAVSEATTDSSKSSSISASAANLFGLEKKVGELPNLVNTDSSADFSGDASTTRKSVVSTTLTARVTEVFPNRNLLIEGNRELLLNGERQIVTLRGVVRPSDISPSNTILSARIAEMELAVTGRGLVSDAQKPGVLFRILSGFWPF
jgi:flagellar L-ring protein precursor FlgH